MIIFLLKIIFYEFKYQKYSNLQNLNLRKTLCVKKCLYG